MYKIRLHMFKSEPLYWSDKKNCYVSKGNGEQLYQESDLLLMDLDHNQTWEKVYTEDNDVHL